MKKGIQERIKSSKRIVIKVGTSTLTYENGNLNLGLLNKLAWVLSDLRNQGRDVILVTSGAIGVGSKNSTLKLDLRKLERNKQQQQLDKQN